jgi:hypothetical protein
MELRLRLHEIFVHPEDAERRKKLQREIADGKEPDVVTAEYHKGKYSFGDLEALGWARKNQEHRGNEIGDSWVYLGPRPITVDGKKMEEGDSTPTAWWDPT